MLPNTSWYSPRRVYFLSSHQFWRDIVILAMSLRCHISFLLIGVFRVPDACNASENSKVSGVKAASTSLTCVSGEAYCCLCNDDQKNLTFYRNSWFVFVTLDVIHFHLHSYKYSAGLSFVCDIDLCAVCLLMCRWNTWWQRSAWLPRPHLCSRHLKGKINLELASLVYNHWPHQTERGRMSVYSVYHTVRSNPTKQK